MWAVFPPPSPPLISYWFLVSHQTSLLGCKKYVSFQPSGWKGGGGGESLKVRTRISDEVNQRVTSGSGVRPRSRRSVGSVLAIAAVVVQFYFPISRLSLAVKWITFLQMRWTNHRDHQCEGQRRRYRLDPCLHFRWWASCPRAERSKDLRRRIVHQGFHRTKRQHVNFEGLQVNPLLANINIYFLYFPVTRTRRIVLKM